MRAFYNQNKAESKSKTPIDSYWGGIWEPSWITSMNKETATDTVNFQGNQTDLHGSLFTSKSYIWDWSLREDYGVLSRLVSLVWAVKMTPITFMDIA